MIILKLRETVKKKDIRIVFAFLPSSLVLISLVKITSCRLFKDLKIIMCIRSSTKQLDQKKFYMYKLIVKKSPDFYIANSYFLKDELINIYKIEPNKIQVIKNKIDPKIFYLLNNPPPVRREKKLKIITVGNAKKVKNYEKILRVMRALEDEGYKFCYSHIGETRFIQTEKYKNSNQIHFLGPQTHLKTLRAIYRSDIFINYSESEGASNAVLEALCLGTICVLSDIPSNREVAGSNGRFCNSEIDLMLVLKKFLKNNKLIEAKYRDKRARGLKYIETYNYNLKKESNYINAIDIV